MADTAQPAKRKRGRQRKHRGPELTVIRGQGGQSPIEEERAQVEREEITEPADVSGQSPQEPAATVSAPLFEFDPEQADKALDDAIATSVKYAENRTIVGNLGRELSLKAFKFITAVLPLDDLEAAKRQLQPGEELALPQHVQDYFHVKKIPPPHLNSVNPFLEVFKYIHDKGQFARPAPNTAGAADYTGTAQSQFIHRQAKMVLAAIDMGDVGVITDWTYARIDKDYPAYQLNNPSLAKNAQQKKRDEQARKEAEAEATRRQEAEAARQAHADMMGMGNPLGEGDEEEKGEEGEDVGGAAAGEDGSSEGGDDPSEGEDKGDEKEEAPAQQEPMPRDPTKRQEEEQEDETATIDLLLTIDDDQMEAYTALPDQGEVHFVKQSDNRLLLVFKRQ